MFFEHIARCWNYESFWNFLLEFPSTWIYIVGKNDKSKKCQGSSRKRRERSCPEDDRGDLNKNLFPNRDLNKSIFHKRDLNTNLFLKKGFEQKNSTEEISAKIFSTEGIWTQIFSKEEIWANIFSTVQTPCKLYKRLVHKKCPTLNWKTQFCSINMEWLITIQILADRYWEILEDEIEKSKAEKIMRRVEGEIVLYWSSSRLIFCSLLILTVLATLVIKIMMIIIDNRNNKNGIWNCAQYWSKY